jgi:hypothetical protein
MKKQILFGLLAVVLTFSVARAIYVDSDYDGWVIIPTVDECQTMARAGMPMECVDLSPSDCPRCGGDINGNRVWCNFIPQCRITTGNYAVYLTTLGQSGEHNHDERYYTKTEVDNFVNGLNNRLTTVETSITGMLSRITQLENYVSMIICQLLPKGLVKGMSCPVY